MIDLYSVKPVDEETLRAAAEATGGRFVVVEDHWPEGGLGEAVLSALAEPDERPVVQLAVREMPGSGKPGGAARGRRHRRRRDRRGRARARREHRRRNDLTQRS